MPNNKHYLNGHCFDLHEVFKIIHREFLKCQSVHPDTFKDQDESANPILAYGAYCFAAGSMYYSLRVTPPLLVAAFFKSPFISNN